MSEFNTTAAQNAAKQYAATYGNIPGYNQFGQWTGQTGGFSPSTFLSGGAPGAGAGSGVPTGAAAGALSPQAALAGFDAGFTQSPINAWWTNATNNARYGAA